MDLRGTIFTFIVVSILFTVSLTFKTPPQVPKGICDSRRRLKFKLVYLYSPLFFLRLIEGGDHHCHGDLDVPCDVAFFLLLFFFHSVCRNAAPSLYFEPKPNLSKTIEGLPMRPIIIVNTIL